MSANHVFEAKAKLFTKEIDAKPEPKSSTRCGEFFWFSLYFHFAHRGGEGWQEFTRQLFDFC